MRLPELESTMTHMWIGRLAGSSWISSWIASRALSDGFTSCASTKGVILKKHWLTSVTAASAVAAVLAGSAIAGTVTSTKLITFTATYAGTANVTVADGVSTISSSGPGKGASIGVGKVLGTGTGTADSNATCQTFGGTGTIMGAKGAKVNFKITNAQACGDAQGESFSITGRAVVKGGAGTYKKAKGTLKVTGVYTRSAKTFAIKFNGKLTV
jgi:hypothetical protein